MADTTKSMQEIEKQELISQEDTERTRDCQCFVPRADIYEVEDQIVVVTDVPGADETSLEINLYPHWESVTGFCPPNIERTIEVNLFTNQRSGGIPAML